MIDSTIAASLDTGKMTALSYSTQIASMISSILIGNLLTFIYPKIVRKIKETRSQLDFWEQSTLLHAIVCLMIAGFLSIGFEGIVLLFNHGSFTLEDCTIVFVGTAIYIVGQNTNILRDLIYRYFYAIGNTKVPAANSVIVSVVNITISIILVKLIGFYGIAIGTVAASFVSLVNVMISFGKVIGYAEKLWKIIRQYLLNLLLMLVTIAVIALTKQMLPISSKIIAIFIYGFETVIVYVVLQCVFNKRIISIAKRL